MPLEVYLSEKTRHNGLMRAIIADGLDNVYEKILRADEVSVLSHRFVIHDDFGYRVPESITLFYYSDLIDKETVKSQWLEFLHKEQQNGVVKLSSDSKEDYAETYRLLQERNKQTDEASDCFIQTSSYIEPDFDDD